MLDGLPALDLILMAIPLVLVLWKVDSAVVREDDAYRRGFMEALDTDWTVMYGSSENSSPCRATGMTGKRDLSRSFVDESGIVWLAEKVN